MNGGYVKWEEYILLWRLKIDNAYGVPDEYLVSYNYGDN